MDNSIIDVTYSCDKKVKSIGTLQQWDHGIKLRLIGFPESSTLEAHYSYEGQTSNALVVHPIKDSGVFYADIPNELLTQKKAIRCYIYEEDEDNGTTIHEVRISIQARPMPSDYRYEPMDPNDIIPDAEVLAALIENDLLFAVWDDEGILTDEEGNIIEW